MESCTSPSPRAFASKPRIKKADPERVRLKGLEKGGVRRRQAGFHQPQVGGASPPPQFENVAPLGRFPPGETFFAFSAIIFPPPLKALSAKAEGNVAADDTLISRRPRGLELGSNVVIRTYQAEHGGLAFESAPTRRQKLRRNRLMAMTVIAAVAASAAVLQNFNDNLASSGPATPGAGVYSAAR
jgi:hypothetical protein